MQNYGNMGDCVNNLDHTSRMMGIWETVPIKCYSPIDPFLNKKSCIPETFNLLMCVCQVSCVMCGVSPMNFHMSLTQTATATDPRPANSPSMHSMTLLLIFINKELHGPKNILFFLQRFEPFLSPNFKF